MLLRLRQRLRAISRSLNFWILPVEVFGISAKSTVVRAFEGGEMLAAPGDDLGLARAAAGLELDEGAGRLAPFLVGLRHHRGGLHGRMLVERVLDLDRGDVLAA